MTDNVQIFISCVSAEFGNYRDAIRRDLTRPNLDTKIQEDFIAYGGPTLEKLDDYIKHSDAVIHIVGDMTGSMANELSLRYIKEIYPDFANRFPNLKPVLDMEKQLSYTQWEAYLAAYHGKRLFVVTPAEKAERDKRYKKDDGQIVLQQTHLNYLRILGYYNEIEFTTKDELVKKLYQSRLGDLLNKLPRIKPVYLPYKSIGFAFKGRRSTIKELHEMFLTAESTSVAIAVYGLGGTGKTRLAVEYAWQHLHNYTAVLFINAATPELLKTNISNLCQPLKLTIFGDEAGMEQLQYEAVMNWLNQYSGWIMIIDNADTQEAAKSVEDFFVQLQCGHLLITSRTDKWSIQVKKIRLDILDEEDAASFLLETTVSEREQTSNDLELARTIANDLYYLALALEQARAYIAKTELSFEKYLKKWQQSRISVLSWFDEQLMQYPTSVAITWQTSFDQLSPKAITLLNRLAWLAPEPISKSLLDVEWLDSENVDAQKVWEELKQYSLATSTQDKKAFTIHKLVQDVTRDRMNDIAKSRTLTEALHWVGKCFSGDATNVSDWPYLGTLMPHALSLIDHAQIQKNTVEANTLITKVSLLFYLQAKYNMAEPLMRKALEINEQNFGSNHPNVAKSFRHLAQLLQATNRLNQAESLIRKAVVINEQTFGLNHPRVATDLNILTTILKDFGRLQEAEALITRALQIDEQAFGPTHSNVSRDLNNLALVLMATNRKPEAEIIMRRALEVDNKNLGPDHPNVAGQLNNLAILLKDTNRLNEAEALMRKALQISEQSFGFNHPTVAIDLNNLAQILKAKKLFGEAESLMRRALEIDELALDANHFRIATDLSNLPFILKSTNRLKEAELLMRRALKIDEHNFGPSHAKVAKRLHHLVSILRADKRLQEAEPLMWNALEIDEHNLGPNHLKVAKGLNDLAVLLITTNRFQEAEPMMRRALKIAEEDPNTNQSIVAKYSINMALLLKDTNRLQEAEPLIRTAIEIDERNFGSNHPKVASDLTNLATVLLAATRFEEAELLIRKSLEINEQHFGLDHPKVVNGLNLLASLFKSTNRLQKAEPLIRRMLEIDEKNFGPNHPKVASDLTNLVAVLQGANRLEEAEKLIRKALEINEQAFGASHFKVALCLNNLAVILKSANRLEESESLQRKSVTGYLKCFGADHLYTKKALLNYRMILEKIGRTEEETKWEISRILSER